MINAVVDTGFWYALYYEKDEHHQAAKEFMERQCEGLRFIIPFPTLYETINTKFVKNGHHRLIGVTIGGERCCLVHDEAYKHAALEATLQSHHLSLVDMIIRFMIEDTDLHIGAVVTFNPSDFIDVCQQRGVEIVPY